MLKLNKVPIQIDWHSVFEYKDGSLYWKIRLANSRIPIGTKVGTLKSGVYRKVGYKKQTYLAHRIVWEMHNGIIEKGLWIDHINGIRTDNRIENLRLVTPSQNARNRLRHRAGIIPGIQSVKNPTNQKYDKWTVTISLGTYTDKELAKEVSSNARKILKEAKCGLL